MLSGPYTLFAPTEEALHDVAKKLGGPKEMLKKMGKTNLVKVKVIFLGTDIGMLIILFSCSSF